MQLKFLFGMFVLVLALIGNVQSLVCWNCDEEVANRYKCKDQVEEICDNADDFCTWFAWNGQLKARGCATKNWVITSEGKQNGCEFLTKSQIFGASARAGVAEDPQGRFAIKDGEMYEFCTCQTDKCNNQKPTTTTTPKSNRGNGNGPAPGDRGAAASVSAAHGLMFGSSIAVFFLARRIYGF